MMHQPDNHNLAEFNFGTLKHDWEDPRVSEFVDNLDMVNAIAEKSDGFIWRMTDDDMGAGQNDLNGVFGDNPRVASTLSVWRDVASLEKFVWRTVHKQFYQKRRQWFDSEGNSNFVMWWVPAGHKPDLSEAMQRFKYCQEQGATDHAFGWAEVVDAERRQARRCA